MQGDGVGLHPGKLGVVDIDVDEGGSIAGRIAQRKTGANSNHHVGRLHHVVKLVHLLSLCPRTETRAVRQGVVIGDGPLAAG